MTDATFAMFVKIDGRWHFSGVTAHESDTARFARQVEDDMKLTKEAGMLVKTEAYRIVDLETGVEKSDSLAPRTFVPAKGQKYRVTYKTGAQRIPRQAVMVYLGVRGSDTLWSLRPIGGTTILTVADIIRTEEVESSTPVYWDRRA